MWLSEIAIGSYKLEKKIVEAIALTLYSSLVLRFSSLDIVLLNRFMVAAIIDNLSASLNL